MQIIYLKEWILSDLKRIKKEIYRGNKNRKLPKRALHIHNILAMFAIQDSSVVSIKLPNTTAAFTFTKPSFSWYPVPIKE